MEEWVKEFEKRMEDMRGRFGAFDVPFAQVWPGGFGAVPRRHFTAEGVDLKVKPDGVRLSVSEKAGDGVSVTTVYEAKTLDAILALRPELRSNPGVTSVVEQRRKAEEAAKAAAERPASPPFSFHSMGQGTTVESSPGRVKVTITDTGPDGKPVTKTYEGTDLETLKREHPELAERLGGITIVLGGEVPFGALPGSGSAERKFRFGGEPAGTPDGLTGPFGLGLRAAADGRGVSVVAVRPGRDAANLGLQTGDVILSINGTQATFDGPTSARDLIHGAKTGPMTVEILRAGKPMTLKR
jgi:hypothetical protein